MQLSRTEQKRRIKEIEKLVVSLVSLSSQVIDKLPCSEEQKEMIKDAKSLKGGSKKRQLKFITKVMKNDNLETLYTFISDRKGNELVENKQLHEVEYLRDTLLNEALAYKKMCAEHGSAKEWGEFWESKSARAICKELPEADSSSLLRLSYLFAQTRNPRHSREIFRYLFSLKEQQRCR